MREAVAKTFNQFKEQVVEFSKCEGRQPSRHSRDERERQLGEQVYNCLRGRHKLQPGQLEELRACLGPCDADRDASGGSRKRKADAAVEA
eukprot:725612-Karenia_brevis.AAC.1